MLIEQQPILRRCNKCHTEKEIEAFYKHKKCLLGRAYTCKTCVLALVKAWSKTPNGKEIQKRSKKKYLASEHGQQKRLERQNQPEVRARNKARLRAQYEKQKASVAGRYGRWNSELRANYGIDVEDWARMYNVQDRKCAACRTILKFDRHTHVDHNHQTGRVRGLLCRWCNTVVGNAFEDVQRLEALIIYLQAHA